jgi:hypothetical protein
VTEHTGVGETEQTVVEVTEQIGRDLTEQTGVELSLPKLYLRGCTFRTSALQTNCLDSGYLRSFLSITRKISDYNKD